MRQELESLKETENACGSSCESSCGPVEDLSTLLSTAMGGYTVTRQTFEK